MKGWNTTALALPRSVRRSLCLFIMVGSLSSLCFLTTLTSAGVRSSPSSLILPLEAGVRLEPGADRLGHQHESAALRRRRADQRLSDRPLRAAQSHARQPDLLIVGVSGTVAMTEFWQFFLVWGVIVGLGAGGVGSVLTATVGNRWFVARRGLALGILGSASSTGQTDISAVLHGDDRLLRMAHRFDDSDHSSRSFCCR